MMALLVLMLSGPDGHPPTIDRILALADQGQLEAAAELTRTSRLASVDRSQLLGYLALRRGDSDTAEKLLGRVVREAPHRSAAWLYLGIAFYRQGHPGEALRALRQVRSPEARRPEYYQLRARVERLTSSSTLAYATVDEGLRRFEEDPALLREQVSLLIEVGALTQAEFRARELWGKSRDPTRERLWVARAYIDIKDFQRAAALLEVARAALPDRPELAAQLAFVYAEQGHALAAARLLDPRRMGSPHYAFESADQYRLANATEDALRVNAYVADESRRDSQRILILVEGGRLDRALAFADRLGQDHLDRIAQYALAFALAHRGDPSSAERITAALTPGPDLPGLEELQAHLQSCKRQPETCR